MLVDTALDHLGRLPRLVVDPSCGAGSFLVAAADALADRGMPSEEVPGALAGCDVDATALAGAAAALQRWAEERDVLSRSAPPDLRRLDPLRSTLPWADRTCLVVGNPPFLAQRTGDTARDGRSRAEMNRRFGALGPYVDTAAVFLLVACDLLDDGGVAVMVQPQSVLAARDAAPVRERLVELADLVALWGDDSRHFDAQVDVCAPILRRGVSGARRPPVEVRWGAATRPLRLAPAPSSCSTWSPLLAAGLGVPEVLDLPAAEGFVGDVAVTTAGFRDEFYALAAAARSRAEPGWSASSPPLLTVGMVDVAHLDRRSARRLGGRTVTEPRLDRQSLRREHPKVARWVRGRLVPKVLVATQTKVIEAIADPAGRCVPVTPLVSVELREETTLDVWDLLAALSAPPLSALVAAGAAGSGLSVGSVRVSAASLRTLPLPVDREAWRAGAAMLRVLQTGPAPGRSERLRDFGAVMCDAYGVASTGPVLDWWFRHADRA